MQTGVPVVAAASGVVLRVRDGVVDRLVADQTDRTAITNIEAGNCVIIDHGNGWQTQYAHMRKGSVAVKPNTPVAKGTVLGMVGSSGLASFPHVHFVIRHNSRTVDPFGGVPGATGREADRQPLWEQPMEYVPTGLISAGFAPKPPTQRELWQGQFLDTSAARANLPGLVFWVHVFGVLQGDRESFTLLSPTGEKVIDSEKSLAKPSRSWVSYVGKKNTPENPLAKDSWRGVYQLKRGDHVEVQPRAAQPILSADCDCDYDCDYDSRLRFSITITISILKTEEGEKKEEQREVRSCRRYLALRKTGGARRTIRRSAFS